MNDIPTTIKSKKLIKKRRDQILFAAITLFSKKGFHSSTMRELAKESGLTLGNIYDYVGNKEHIFVLIHEFLAKTINDEIERRVSNVIDPIERLRLLVKTCLQVFHEYSAAVLLMYQEGHILKKPMLNNFLKTERAHVNVYERILEDAMKKGLIKNLNIRLTANIIKIMVDCYVLKRWDLKGHVSMLDMEEVIIEILFNGLSTDPNSKYFDQFETPLKGKNVLFFNAGKQLGKNICRYLDEKGAELTVVSDLGERPSLLSVFNSKKPRFIRVESLYEEDRIKRGYLSKLLSDLGPFNYYIHDIGIGNANINANGHDKTGINADLKNTLQFAQDIASFMRRADDALPLERIVYIAPWSWDQYGNLLLYEGVKAASVALTEAMAKELWSHRINVNCIIPGFIDLGNILERNSEGLKEASLPIPSGSLGEGTDVFNALMYLLQDDSRYLTGEVLRVTGGLK